MTRFLILIVAEQAEVAVLTRLRQRVRGKPVVGAMLFHNAVAPEDVIKAGNDFEKAVEQVLQVATGDPDARVYDLRHSFASYLLATLLLPEGADAVLAPTVGPDCVSKARRDRLVPHVIGSNNSGRAALYAVVFLMGHAHPEWTLVYYAHLLDWSVAQYVSRSAFEGLRPHPALSSATTSATGKPEAQRINDSLVQEEWPEWPFVVQALSELIDGAKISLIAKRSGIGEVQLGRWLARLKTIVSYETRVKRQRHRFVASTRGPAPATDAAHAAKRPRFLLPREDIGQNLIASVWRNCRPGQFDATANPDVIWALRHYLVKADPARCDIPLKQVQDVTRYVSALMRLGFDPSHFRVRFQKQGTAHRSPLLDLPPDYTCPVAWQRLIAGTQANKRPIQKVSRYRISVVSEDLAVGHATPSYRIALLLAATAGEFELPLSP